MKVTNEDHSAEVLALVSRGMHSGLHWFPEDVPAERLATVLVGMANAQGGRVLLGIVTRRSPPIGGAGSPVLIQGVHDVPGALDNVFQAALLSDPPLVLPMPRQCSANRMTVIEIVVPAGLPHVYSQEGRYLGREGSQTNPLSARNLRRLLLERGVVQFESQTPPGATLEDLDSDKVGAYVAALHLPGDEKPEEVLLRRGCARRLDGKSESPVSPTYAGLLLFGRQPQRWLPNATLLAARFSGHAMTERFIKQDISGTLPDQLRQAEAFVRDNLRSAVRMVGLTRQETSEYPLEAVRELLVNAVAHRDYNVQGDNIHLNIFADRIEVQSPGGLPGPVNLDNLLEARFSRNVVVVQVLSDLGFVERLGYGLNRVTEVMRQNHLRPPRFEEVAGSFRVTLYGEAEFRPESLEGLQAYQDLLLNPRQESALGFLLQNRRITSHDYQDLCPEVHPETLRRDLADLVERGLLIKVGDKRATYYVLKKRPQS
jgi:ATP-dependent DNA helicase RecG